MTAPLRYRPCAVCRGDGCAACDGAGSYPVAEEWLAPPRPTAPRAPVLPHAGALYLVSAPDGWASWGDTGRDDRWCRRRWALCPSADGRTPLERWRNGGPKGLGRTSSGERAPAWHDRAARFVRAAGGLPMAALPYVAEWFRSHRIGAPDLALVESWCDR